LAAFACGVSELFSCSELEGLIVAEEEVRFVSGLWDLVSTQSELPPQQLAAALREQCQQGLDDPRTRQLAYECSLALQGWNVEIPQVPKGPEPTGKFASLQRRVNLVTTAEHILSFLREISLSLTVECEVIVGGASSLILDHLIQRATEDVDLVDEVPAPIRELRDTLQRAESIYHLHLAHFQSHYLPSGWQSRLTSLPSLRKLTVWRVSSLDVFAGKLFSRREKDLRDLAALRGAFAPALVRSHVEQFCSELLADAKLRSQFQDNWYVLYGEEFPN